MRTRIAIPIRFNPADNGFASVDWMRHRRANTFSGIDGVGHHVRGSRYEARPNIIVSHEIPAYIAHIVMPRRVGVAEWVIDAITVTVVALGIGLGRE